MGVTDVGRSVVVTLCDVGRERGNGVRHQDGLALHTGQCRGEGSRNHAQTHSSRPVGPLLGGLEGIPTTRARAWRRRCPPPPPPPEARRDTEDNAAGRHEPQRGAAGDGDDEPKVTTGRGTGEERVPFTPANSPPTSPRASAKLRNERTRALAPNLAKVFYRAFDRPSSSLVRINFHKDTSGTHTPAQNGNPVANLWIL